MNVQMNRKITVYLSLLYSCFVACKSKEQRESKKIEAPVSVQQEEFIDGLSLFGVGEGEGLFILNLEEIKKTDKLELTNKLVVEKVSTFKSLSTLPTKLGFGGDKEMIEAFRIGMKENLTRTLTYDESISNVKVDLKQSTFNIAFRTAPALQPDGSTLITTKHNIILSQSPSIEDVKAIAEGAADAAESSTFAGTDVLSVINPRYEWQEISVAVLIKRIDESGKKIKERKEYLFQPLDQASANNFKKAGLIRERQIIKSDDYRSMDAGTSEGKDLDAKKLDIAADVIHRAVLSDFRILVHCKSGKGRSASTIAAYLMKYEDYTLEEAIKTLVDASPGTEAIAKTYGNHYGLLKKFSDDLDSDPEVKIRRNLAATARQSES